MAISHILIHPDGRQIVVPVHAGETIGSGLVLQIFQGNLRSHQEKL